MYQSRAYDDQHGEPVVVLVTTGTHDVSHLIQLLQGRLALCEHLNVADTVLRQVKRHNGGRAALSLLKLHGGPDFTTDAEQPAAPHTVTVTRLTNEFDSNDVREHEYLIYTGNLAPVSHLVSHPAACDELPYGRRCWFDEMWEGADYSYEETAPGVYSTLPAVEQVGHPETGEFDFERWYIHYAPVAVKAAA